MRYYSSTAVETTLTASLSAGSGTCTVASTSGFPTQYPFTGVLDEGTISEEVVEVTGVAGLTLTITRGVDGSAGVAHANGATFAHSVTARDLREPQEHIAATTEIHGIGAGSAVVGTTDAQTLTNKTLTEPTIASLTNAQHTHANAAGGGMIPESSVTNLVADLAAKSATGHTHVEADVTSLVADLAAKVPNSLVTTKGDLVAATAASTPARQGVGTDGQRLEADSAAATGVGWKSTTQAQAYASGSTSLTSATWGVIALAAEDADSGTMHDNVTNNSRVVAPTAGVYLVVAQLTHVNTATGIRRLQVRKNAAGNQASGTALISYPTESNPTAGTSVTLSGMRVVTLAANDYVEMFGYQSSGGANGITTGADFTFLHLTKLGA